MKRALFAVPLMFVLSACGTAEDTSIESVSLHEGAQRETCRLDDTICSGVVLHDMVGTPTLLKAFLVRRVGHTAVIDRALEIPTPNIQSDKEYTLIVRNFANSGDYYLAVTLEVVTSRTGHLDASSDLSTPAWTHETIRHADAESFDLNSATRRGNSWFESQNSRFTAPAEIAEQQFENPVMGDQFVDLPNLRGRYDLEYIGWSSIFTLDGSATNAGIIELQPRLDNDVPFDGHAQFPTP